MPAAISALTAGAVAFGSPAAADEAQAPEYREDGPYQLVCNDDPDVFADRNEAVAYNQRIVNERLFEECRADGHRDVAEALAAVDEPATRILILPGRYTVEEAIVVDGAEDLQIEGLGDGPEDVVVAAGYDAEAVLAAADATGLYLKGLTLTGGGEAGLTVTGSRGVTIEMVHGTRNGRNGIRIADSTEVLLADCAASVNDGAGIAVADADAEIGGCDSSGNLIGLLKTGGGEATVQSSRLHGNTAGLVVADTASGHRLSATANAIYENNTDHYGRLESAECTGPAAERDWSSGALCPDRTAPIGVGILLTEANDTTVTGNHIWGQQTAAAMVWGDPGLTEAGSHRNRFEANTLGYRDDGQRFRNRLDLWWDGQGEGNCFDEPAALHTTPAVLPGCEAASGPNRLAAEPVKTYKVWQCGTGAVEAGVPDGCDWFGAKFTDRLEFQASVLFAAALLFLTGAGWLGAARSEEPPAPMSMTFSAIATGSAALLMVLASWSGRSDYEALAIGLWGVGWILAGRSWFSSRLNVFGGFTCLIGGLALLDAIDRGVWIIPVMPFSPAWMWLLLLPLWTLLALAAVFRRRPKQPAGPPVERTPATVPVYNRFDW
ncbi:hypothetical protein GCM10027447_32200 [Glycomyces halotolerans]